MSADILKLAYSLRITSTSSNCAIKLSHAQQLIAAALGYGSLAAYQASNDECEQIDDGVSVLVYTDLLRSRAIDLGIHVDIQVLLDLLAEAFHQQLPEGRLYPTESDFSQGLMELIEAHVLNDDLVVSQTAMTNSDGIREVYFEVDFSMDQLPPVGDYFELSIRGHVTMEQDIERPYSGHRVDVEVVVTAERPGQAILGPATVRVSSAKLDYGWGSEGDEEVESRVTLAQALADELDLDLTDAEQLIDVEPVELTGSSGEMVYSLMLDFTDVARPEIAKKILAKHGTLKIEVSANFFDHVIPEFD